MPANHLTREALTRFAKNTSLREERLDIVRHLLVGCDRCSRMAAEVLHLSPAEGAFALKHKQSATAASAHSPEADGSFDRAAERLLGWSQWACLETLSADERLRAVDLHRELQHGGLCSRLLEASNWAVRYKPRQGIDIALLALRVAHRLDAKRYGEPQVARYRSAAWAALAHAKRYASDFEGSSAAIKQGWEEYDRSSRDLISRVTLACIEASLRVDLRQHRAAESLLEAALSACREGNNQHLEGKTLLQLGVVKCYYAPDRAVPVLRKSMSLIDPSDKRLELFARANIAYAMTYLRRPRAALEELNEARPLYRQFDDFHVQVRLRWLEGRILRSFGNFSAAINIFGEVWEKLRIAGLPHDLDAVAVDLAWTCERQALRDPGPPP